MLRTLKGVLDLRSVLRLREFYSKRSTMSSLSTGGGGGDTGLHESIRVNISRAVASERLPGISSHTMECLYAPIYEFLVNELQKLRLHSPEDPKRTLFVGLSAPQGCGKTTLSKVIKTALSYENISCLYMSLDDFYLKAVDQVHLSASHPSNGLLKYRGNAGTHDIHLIKSTLQSLKTGSTFREGSREHYCEKIEIPQYDKTLNSGRGDRSKDAKVLSDKIDIVLFEGWMMGFAKVPEENLFIPKEIGDSVYCLKNLQEVNNYLNEYKGIYEFLDSWIIMYVDDLSIIYEWREAAEQISRDNGKPALSKTELRDFVDRFIPAYHNYVPSLIDIENNLLGSKATLKVKVDASRKVCDVSKYNL